MDYDDPSVSTAFTAHEITSDEIACKESDQTNESHSQYKTNQTEMSSNSKPISMSISSLLHSLQNSQNEFDYIIVGGGTSGCLLARRLASASSDHRILLIEAGGEAEEDADNLIPGLVVPKYGSEAGNWLYKTVPQRELNGRELPYPRGRGMGGSSANNFGSWVRGPKCDWDSWAEQVGDEWWRWENVVGYMKGLEDFHEEVPPGREEWVDFVEGMHFRGGPIGVGVGREWQDVVEFCLKGAMEAGFGWNGDHNDGEEMGVSVAQMNVDFGERRSGAAAFLGREKREELRQTGRLVVVTRTLCRRVVFEGKRAVGVELMPAAETNGEEEGVTVRAKKEIVLAAGTFASAHMLLLSGVGPASELARHGIDVVHDSPCVGKNMRDHSAFSIEAVIDPAIRGHNQLLQDPRAMEAARQQYGESRTGPLAVFGASAALLFARVPELYESNEFGSLPQHLQAFLGHPDRPSTELWMHGGPLFFTGKVDPQDSVVAIEGLGQNLLARGSLSLRSADPRDFPLIDPAYCTEPYDWRIVIETTKVQLRILQSPTIQSILRKTIHGPGERNADGSITLCEPADEEAIRRFLKAELHHGFHAMASCAMGREGDPNRVVDTDCNLVGLEGLRIADMSVCPILTNNHTQINAYLIAERCAQAMLGEKSEVRLAANR